MSLVKSSSTIGGYTLITRVLGFVRDVTIASNLGAGMLSDAFFVAFKIPNFLRRLFAEGAFSAAFVPLFAGMLATDGEEKAKAFASEAMSFLIMALLAVTGIMMAIMPYLMLVLAPGFSDNPEKFELTVTLTRITLPYIIFISLVTLLGGILNSAGLFAAAAAAPILLNLSLIIVPEMIGGLTPTMAHALAVSVAVAGVLQWLWMVHCCKKRGMLPKLVRPRMSPNVKKMLALIAPAALGAGVAQINLFIDMMIASQFDSGVSYLYYADRINQLPLGVIGIAVSTAMLPLLSKQVREGNHKAAFVSQRRAIEFALFLSMPAAFAMMALAQPIISVMFERGAFGPAETAATYPALIAFAAGLPAFVMAKILTPAFYARQDTKTPVKIAIVCIAVNLAFNLLLMGPFRHVGMAMATSISAWVNVAMLLWVLLKREWIEITRDLIVQLAKMAAISILTAACALFAAEIAAPWLVDGEIVRFGALGMVALTGILFYLMLAYASNCVDFRNQVKKRVGKRKA